MLSCCDMLAQREQDTKVFGEHPLTSSKSSNLSLQFSQYPGFGSFLVSLFFLWPSPFWLVVFGFLFPLSSECVVSSSWICPSFSGILYLLDRFDVPTGFSVRGASAREYVAMDIPILFFSKTFLFSSCTSLLTLAFAPGTAAVDDIICERIADVMLEGWTPDAAGSRPRWNGPVWVRLGTIKLSELFFGEGGFVGITFGCWTCFGTCPVSSAWHSFGSLTP